MLNWSEGKSYRFVLHEHHAKRAGLHYDLRIMRDDGNLESFATRKNPVKLPKGKKQLLIRQPLHEKYWLTFQGVIKDGYGAGTLKIADKGTVKVIRNEKKVTTFEFKGTKLKGQYAIVYLSDNNYLLVRRRFD